MDHAHLGEHRVEHPLAPPTEQLAEQRIQQRIEHRIVVRDGLSLFVADHRVAPERRDRERTLPVVCLPGLSRNSRDFARFAEIVSAHPEKPRRVLSFDYRGRGQSDWDPDPSRYTVPVEAGDVVEICAALGIEAAIFVGTSRGGLILHQLPTLAPNLSRANILNDIGPVIETDGLLAIARYLGEEGRYRSWRAASTALRMLHGPAFPALDPEDWDEMARALYREDAGVIVPDFDPALVAPLAAWSASVAAAPKALPDLWPLFAGLAHRPLMTIRGETSTLFSDATVLEMTRRHPGMISLTAAGQGHAPLLHHPGVIAPILGFFDGLD